MQQALQIMLVTVIMAGIVSFLVALMIHLLCKMIRLTSRRADHDAVAQAAEIEQALVLAIAHYEMARRKKKSAQ